MISAGLTHYTGTIRLDSPKHPPSRPTPQSDGRGCWLLHHRNARPQHDRQLPLAPRSGRPLGSTPTPHRQCGRHGVEECQRRGRIPGRERVPAQFHHDTGGRPAVISFGAPDIDQAIATLVLDRESACVHFIPVRTLRVDPRVQVWATFREGKLSLLHPRSILTSSDRLYCKMTACQCTSRTQPNGTVFLILYGSPKKNENNS